MAMLCDKTLLMAAGAGYLVALQGPGADSSYVGKCGRVSLLARAECYVQFVAYDGVSTAPAAPSASPAPAPGAEAAYIHLLAGERISRGAVGQTANPYTHIRVWAIVAGDLVVDAE